MISVLRDDHGCIRFFIGFLPRLSGLQCGRSADRGLIRQQGGGSCSD